MSDYFELRLAVKITKDKVWDDRWDEWRPITLQSPPILQYRQGLIGKWTDVPVVEVEV